MLYRFIFLVSSLGIRMLKSVLQRVFYPLLRHNFEPNLHRVLLHFNYRAQNTITISALPI